MISRVQRFKNRFSARVRKDSDPLSDECPVSTIVNEVSVLITPYNTSEFLKLNIK